MADKYVIGIDLGGTKVEACLMNTQRKVLNRYREPSQADMGLEHVIEKIAGVAAKTASGKPYQAAGMGTPGTYVPAEDKLYGSPHTPVYETKGFIGKLRRRLKVPLLIENDANCLALAEYFAQCKNRYNYVMAVILGTGMGSGLILDGRLYRGGRGAAGEIGHAAADMNGRLCECGRRGCPEAYLSGPSLSRRYHEKTGLRLEVPDIYRRFQSGDKHAEYLFQESCRIMAEVFANAVSILDLEAIVLGGGVSNCSVWYEQVPEIMGRLNFGVERNDIPLLKAEMGDSAGVVGAAYLALRHLGIMDF